MTETHLSVLVVVHLDNVICCRVLEALNAETGSFHPRHILH